MALRDAGAVILHRDRGGIRPGLQPDDNPAVVRRKAQRVLHQVTEGLPEKERLCLDPTFALARDRDVSLFRRRLVIRRDFFHGLAPVERGGLDRVIGGLGPCQEKQIIDDTGKPRAFRHAGLDHLAIFVRGSFSR